MALLDWMAQDGDLRLEGEGVRLRPYRASDYTEWASLRERSRGFLQPWEPTWPADDLTRAAFRRRLAAYAQDQDRGEAYAFLIFGGEKEVLVGGITLRHIRRGVAQMGSIGYWIGEPFVRRGHAVAAVSAVLAFAFDRLRLHRIEAACIPDNMASRGVLTKAGFEQEGYAKAYLKIDGRWRDHLLFARLT